MLVTFKIHYNTLWGESLSLVLQDRKYPMTWNDGGVWSVSVEASAAAMRDYSYVVMYDGLISRWEWSHHCGKPAKLVEDSWIDCPIPGCRFNRKHSAGIFDRPGFRGAGTAVPIFSLRTADDFGIGEFRDLRPLVDWAAQTGQCIIQLLPVNDTTRKGGWDDSYPYNPISSFALHPLYIHLQDLGIKETAGFKREQEELNALPELDYPRVFKSKMAMIRRAFENSGKKDLGSAAYKKFYRNNACWLDEYAEFCAKRDGLEKEYYCWIQFHLDRQLSEEVAYAHSRNVYLKGDLPIGVSRDSADAYWHPQLFNLDSNAGAPPDFFSAQGQNWGFPTYNWEEMAKDDYAWWKARLRKMSEYFDAFRIDHILGFFRIWEIPAEFQGGIMGHFNPALPYSEREISGMGLPIDGLFLEDPHRKGFYHPLISPQTNGLEGWQKERFDSLYTDFFYHRHNEFWRRNAEKKLPELLGVTGMLACGEDLGMVPDCVPGVMEHQRILSLEMPQMDKGRPWPEMSVCATSSHDMETLRMQHEGDPEPWECYRTLDGILHSSSMLAIFPLQDWLSITGDLRRKDCTQERINQPADPHHHWRFRIHLDLNRIKENPGFCTQVSSLLKDSGRFV